VITQLVLLVYTGSIATIGACVLFVAMVGYRERWIKKKSFYWLLPVIIIAIVTAIVLKFDSIMVRLSVIVNPKTLQLTEGSSLRWRWDAWAAYISLLGDNFLHWMFGLGVGSQRYILHPDYPNSLWRLFDSPGTHNDYLGALIDFGLMGLFFLLFSLAFFYDIIRRAEQRVNKLFYLRYYLITVGFIMLTENFIDQLIMFVFIVFTTAIICSRREGKDAVLGSLSNKRINDI
jgi:O-antigen ligase